MRFTLTALTLATTLLAVPTLSAQDTKPKPAPDVKVKTVTPAPTLALWAGATDRAVLGVTLAASSRADTAGVRIEDVDTDGPAAKAGIKAGDVITEINGVNLRVSAVDAEDLALAGIAQRRLQRTMAKSKPGDEVDLQLRSGGAARAVKVKTVSAAELDGAKFTTTWRVRSDSANENRGAIGVSVGSSGSRRDSLGLFVSSVVPDGPAEKAGLVEGERIAAVNGVDVRVPKEDFEDRSATSARVNRFVREVQKVAPGGTLNLRVYGNGRYRDVAVKAVKTSELPSGAMQWFTGDGNGMSFFSPSAPNGTVIQMAPRGGEGRLMITRPGVRIRADGHEFEYEGEAVRKAMEQVRVRMQELGRDLRFEVRGTPAKRTSAI